MNTERPRLRIAVLVWAIVWALALVLSTMAVAQNAPSVHHRVMPQPILPHAAKAPRSKSGKVPQAMRLALERYQFLKRLEPRFGFFPLKYGIYVVFPFGRSDRVYFWPFGEYRNSPNGLSISCFQSNKSRGQKENDHLDPKHNLAPQDQFVYQMNLQIVHTGATMSAKSTKSRVDQLRRAASLLDIIRAWGTGPGGITPSTHYDILGSISPLVMKDLTAKRDYAMYIYNDYSGGGEVFRIRGDVRTFDGKGFSTDQDPITKARLKSDQFFAKYGLPVLDDELQGRR